MINHHGFGTSKVQEIYKGHRVIKEPINFINDYLIPCVSESLHSQIQARGWVWATSQPNTAQPQSMQKGLESVW